MHKRHLRTCILHNPGEAGAIHPFFLITCPIPIATASSQTLPRQTPASKQRSSLTIRAIQIILSQQLPSYRWLHKLTVWMLEAHTSSPQYLEP